MTNPPPDRERCRYTTTDGKRCRQHRLQGDDQSLCYFHFNRSQKIVIEPHPGFVADQILPPEASFDSARAINQTLTRIFRFVADGRLSTRHAYALTYVCQSAIATVPQLEREAAAANPPHVMLGADPEEAIAGLAHALRQSVTPAAGESPRSDKPNADPPSQNQDADDGSLLEGNPGLPT